MRLLAWNVQAGGARRAAHIAAAIDAAAPDVLALTEVRSTSTPLLKMIEGLGYTTSCVGAGKARCGAAALLSRVEMQATPSPLDVILPSRWVEAYLPAFDTTVVALYGPLGGEDFNGFWRRARETLVSRNDRRFLVAGDFNTGSSLTDARSKRFFCSDHFTAIQSGGLVDAWRHLNGDKREYSYVHRAPNGRTSQFRIDHALVSRPLVGAVKSVRYLHSARQARMSDHSPLLVELQ